MLPKKHRLPLRDRFVPELQVQTPQFSLKVKPNPSEISRFAFIVSKRVAKRAVDRSSTKRIFRHCIQESLSKIKPGYDMLFVAKKNVINDSAEKLCQQIHQELQKKSLMGA